MQKIRRTALTLTALVLAFIMISIPAMGLTHQTIISRSGLTVSTQGYNTVGVKGTGLYSTNTSKVVTGCTVRLREGTFDQSANNHSARGGWTTEVKKVNNIIKTAYTSYSWRY